MGRILEMFFGQQMFIGLDAYRLLCILPYFLQNIGFNLLILG